MLRRPLTFDPWTAAGRGHDGFIGGRRRNVAEDVDVCVHYLLVDV